MKFVPSSHPFPFDAWSNDWQQIRSPANGDEFAQWHQQSLYDANVKNLLQPIVNNSPYLAKLLLQFPDVAYQYFTVGADSCFDGLLYGYSAQLAETQERTVLMKLLRQLKSKAALCIAMADIQGAWELMRVTQALTQLADFSVEMSLSHLLCQAHKLGEIQLMDKENPTRNSGIIVFGMGKMGAFELNYSSDIDLIIFFERDKLGYKGRHGEQKFLNKIAQDLVQILHERTVDGYVFRTDLRLRPDPSSTPLAVSVEAAMHYYEGVGQNWERAAMIKARAVAGDIEAGNALLKQLVPFVWRKNLDFATIQDILSIKRQINHKVGSDINIAGHNVKLGKGGIREIEFFVQLHQLIWGGRQPALRNRSTLATLKILVELNHLSSEKAEFLEASYIFLRMLEHRLQMVADQQTHSMPAQTEAIANIASFMGFEDMWEFEKKLKRTLHDVHEIFVTSFQSEGLSADKGNLVFTGTNNDPDTLKTLRSMGFENAETVSETIMGWHHGSRRCMRTKRSRQILTELVPNILQALSGTANPNAAFLKFDAFLEDLPAGVQIFSLFVSNPHLLQLIASIMGSAPTLSATLSKRPELLESALFSDFYNTLPTKEQMQNELEAQLSQTPYFDAAMEQLRIYKNEKQFQAGVQLLKKLSEPDRVSAHLSMLADLLLEKSLDLCLQEFRKSYGDIEGSGLAMVALGKLGSSELTFGSDIDLVFVYDTPDYDKVSNGKQQHSASVYYNRLAQRLINAITAIGNNGQLFEIDTRLRPSGKQGLLAVSTHAFEHYFLEMAWTFEHMALVKARVVATSNTNIQQQLNAQIQQILLSERDIHSLTKDITEMRQRVEQEFAKDNIWDVKHAKGGLMDIDFIAQLFVLGYAHQYPQLLKRSSGLIFSELLKLDAFRLLHSDIDKLRHGNSFLVRLQHILRLSSEESAVLSNPPIGLANLLSEYMETDNFNVLKNHLTAIEQQVREAYIHIIEFHQQL